MPRAEVISFEEVPNSPETFQVEARYCGETFVYTLSISDGYDTPCSLRALARGWAYEDYMDRHYDGY